MLLEVKLFDSVDLHMTCHECHVRYPTRPTHYFKFCFMSLRSSVITEGNFFLYDTLLLMAPRYYYIPRFVSPLWDAKTLPLSNYTGKRALHLLWFNCIFVHPNVYTSRAFSNHSHSGGNFPVWLWEKMAFEMVLSLWCSGKKGSTWRRTSEDEGQAWSTVSLILDGRKGAKSQIMRKELQFF